MDNRWGELSGQSTQIYLLDNGRSTVFQPCENRLTVKEKWRNIGSTLFTRTKDGQKIGLSQEDREFLDLMDESVTKDDSGNWVAPLPFRKKRPLLPNNREQVLKRTENLHHSLRREVTWSRSCSVCLTVDMQLWLHRLIETRSVGTYQYLEYNILRIHDRLGLYLTPQHSSKDVLSTVSS